MLDALLDRPDVRDAEVLTTTITAGNTASWALFEGWARGHGFHLSKRPFFIREDHFAGEHDTEWLVTIGRLPERQEQTKKEDT